MPFASSSHWLAVLSKAVRYQLTGPGPGSIPVPHTRPCLKSDHAKNTISCGPPVQPGPVHAIVLTAIFGRIASFCGAFMSSFGVRAGPVGEPASHVFGAEEEEPGVSVTLLMDVK